MIIEKVAYKSLFSFSIAILSSCLILTPSIALNLENPPVSICVLKKSEAEKQVQRELLDLEAVLFNWKMTHKDMISLLNQYYRNKISSSQLFGLFDNRVKRLSELNDVVDSKVKSLSREKDLAGMLSLAESQKSAALLYVGSAMRFILLKESVSDQRKREIQENYDVTWRQFSQSWNMTFLLFGCSSTNPWVTF